tara:strand:- start:41 stop:625 length:585 start_codon:yes stop_codon:yes gene_type:complete
MPQANHIRPEDLKTDSSVELVIDPLTTGDLNDLCDATDAAIEDGGGFGWVDTPSRDVMERYWQGVVTIPSRLLFVTRLDGTICGTAQLVLPPRNNEAQSFAGQLTSLFITPWARGHGLGTKLLKFIEETARTEELEVLNLDVRETQYMAIKLYENNGYVHMGTHPYYASVNGETVPGRYYYKMLKSRLTGETKA